MYLTCSALTDFDIVQRYTTQADVLATIATAEDGKIQIYNLPTESKNQVPSSLYPTKTLDPGS